MILFHGNSSNICLFDTLTYSLLTSIKTLDKGKVLFVFSSAGKGYSLEEIDSLENFVLNGGGLYIGAENWPLQTEANQLTDRMFQKKVFGYYSKEVAETSKEGNFNLEELNQFPSGKTSVAFPLDHRLLVEAWIEDQPLILSGYYGKGRVVLDGGYSRFYCNQINSESKRMMGEIYNFLRDD